MLFADMGRFGKNQIRKAWYCIVLRVYSQLFRTGAYLLSMPGSAENLFFRIVPQWFLYPMVLLSLSAALIASQAVISGAYSLTRQCVQLGFWPRSGKTYVIQKNPGPVYVPLVNWCLMAGVIILMLSFGYWEILQQHTASPFPQPSHTTVLITAIARTQWIRPFGCWPFSRWFFSCIDGSVLSRQRHEDTESRLDCSGYCRLLGLLMIKPGLTGV